MTRVDPRIEAEAAAQVAADEARITDLCALIDKNSEHLSREFLQARMLQAKAVDEVLGKMI